MGGVPGRGSGHLTVPYPQRRAAATGPRRPDDAGASLAEMLVTLALLSTMLVIVTSAVLRMYREVDHAESIGSAQSQVITAYQRLDRQIRYASDITKPAVVAGAWYVEFQTVTGGASICTELRVTSDQLQSRTWTETKVARTKTPWSVVTSGVQTGATAPFAVEAADATAGFERLRLRLNAAAGAGTRVSRSQVDITFTALNTFRDGKESGCTEGRTVP